jgi:hypothetical protein
MMTASVAEPIDDLRRVARLLLGEARPTRWRPRDPDLALVVEAIAAQVEEGQVVDAREVFAAVRELEPQRPWEVVVRRIGEAASSGRVSPGDLIAAVDRLIERRRGELEVAVDRLIAAGDAVRRAQAAADDAARLGIVVARVVAEALGGEG